MRNRRNRRSALVAFVQAAAALLVVAALVPGATARAAEEWPQRQPITMIVPFAPGGASDFVARIIQVPLSKELKQTIVIDNRAGAAGNIGMEVAARSPADGYTVYLGNIGTIAVNPHIFGAQLKVKPLVDFIPITQIVDVPDIMVENTSVPAKTVKEFVDYAKARKGQLNFGTPGAGSVNRLEMELFMQEAGIDMLHVPYKGGAGPAVTDLIGGQVQVMFVTLPSAVQFVKAGRLRALGVTLRHRVKDLPDTPTMLEAGYDIVASSWQGLFVPKGTPAPIVQKIFAAAHKVMAMKEVSDKLGMGGVLVETSKSPEAFTQFITKDSARWGKVIQERGIKIE